jgi:TonB family protein
MRIRLTILFLCVLSGGVSVSAQDAETALKQFEGKILILRHPLQGDSQRYDAEGMVLKGGDEGPWAVYGGVLIDHVVVEPNKLQLAGQRILFLFPNQRFTLMKFELLDNLRKPPLSPSIKVEIALAKPIDSAEQAQGILNRVFALNTADLTASVSDFWQRLLTDHLIYDPSQKQEEEFRWKEPVRGQAKPVGSAEPQMTNSHESAGTAQPVFHVGSEVKAPKPEYTPAPEFSEAARYEKFQGTDVVNFVVDKTGAVHSIKLVRPLGLGLDDSARKTIQTWRFHPAIRNGEPVAVELSVEVGFHLY